MSEECLLILPLFIPSLCQLSKPPFATSISCTNKKINVYSAVSSNLSQPWVVLHMWDSYRSMNLVDTLDTYSKGVALHPQTLNRRVSGCGAESVRIRAKQLVNAAPLNIHWAFPLFFHLRSSSAKLQHEGYYKGIISSHLISTRDINHKQKVATHIRARSTCPLMGLDGRVRARAGHHVFAHPFSSFFLLAFTQELDWATSWHQSVKITCFLFFLSFVETTWKESVRPTLLPRRQPLLCLHKKWQMALPDGV